LRISSFEHKADNKGDIKQPFKAVDVGSIVSFGIPLASALLGACGTLALLLFAIENEILV